MQTHSQPGRRPPLHRVRLARARLRPTPSIICIDDEYLSPSLAPTKVNGSGRVPHVRPGVHGPKTGSFRMLSLHGHPEHTAFTPQRGLTGCGKMPVLSKKAALSGRSLARWERGSRRRARLQPCRKRLPDEGFKPLRYAFQGPSTKYPFK
jgi:hypothetical protein